MTHTVQTQPPGTGLNAQPRTAVRHFDDDGVSEHLYELYGHAFRRSQAHTAMRKRTDPITVISDEALKTIGDYFPLVGYEPAVDCLIRSLCRLHQGFDTSITRQLYKELQLLRIVGAPGLGKSTFMSHVWGMLVPRLAQLLEQGLPATAAWEGHSREGLRQLHERMEKAWAAGPLVFRQDMSNEDLKQLDPLETQHNQRVQAGARMLWACLDGKQLGMASYQDLLSDLAHNTPLLPYLSPFAILLFVHKAAQLGRGAPSVVCFVWENTHAVEIIEGRDATFLQYQVSVAVGARESMLSHNKLGHADMLPVMVTTTTEGSTASLASVRSNRSLVRDLILPQPHDLQLQKLVVADVMRRLDLPPELRALFPGGRGVHLSSLTDSERGTLADACPPHVVDVLGWTGGNMRTLALALGVLSGSLGQQEEAGGMRPGAFKWWTDPASAPPLPDVLSRMTDVLVSQHGWSRWLDSQHRPQASPILQAVARSLSGISVTRSRVLVEGRGVDRSINVTVQQLEADGVVELHYPGLHSHGGEVMPAPSPGSASTQKHRKWRPEVGLDPCTCFDPDNFPHVEMPVVLPPLLLLAYMRSPQMQHQEQGSSAQLRTIRDLVSSWRAREYEDLSAFLLRLQLRVEIFDYTDVVDLGSLLPPLYQADHPLADVSVLLPHSGFQPRVLGSDVKKQRLQQLVAAVARGEFGPDGYPAPWCFAFAGNRSGPDAMIVLKECERDWTPVLPTVVISVQSKLRASCNTAVTWEAISKEASRVPVLTGNTKLKIKQLFVFITDQCPSGQQPQNAVCINYSPNQTEERSQQPANASSDSTLSGSQAGASALAPGKAVPAAADPKLCVVALLRDQHWHLRGALNAVRGVLQPSGRTG